MTNKVQVKRVMSVLLLLSLLTSCNTWNAWFGRDETNLGEYITLQAENVAEGTTVTWSFAQLPDSSKILGFLPSDTVSIVSFKPDVPGEYDVIMTVTNADDVEETSYFYEAVVPEDSSLVNREMPEHLFQALLEKEDTTAAEIPEKTSYTDDGVQRTYLAKVVSPNAAGKTATPKPTKARSKTKRTATPVNRGNLIPQATKTYTIQLSSWPSFEEAQSAAKELMDDYGIDGYVQRAFFKDKDEVFYRLRVGNFNNFSEAEAVAKEIQGMTSLPAWVDFVRQEM